MPTILVFMGVLGLYFASSESRRQIMESEIEDNARHYFSMIEEELKISRNKLSGYLAFYNASEHVTREEFDAFSKIQLERDRILHGVGWTEIVPASERERYESEIRAAGIKNFSFTELTSEGELKIAQSREHYYPVLYIYPLESNKKALGLNLAANQERLKALVQARDQSRAIATAPIRLVQESGSQLGIILYLPVFCNKFDPVHQSEIDGGEHFRGYISGVYRVANIFGNIIDKANQNHYGVTINDVTEPGKPVSLISSKQAPLKQFEPKRHIIDFGGRKLKVNFYPTSQFKVLSRDWASWIILTSGFLFAAMLQSFILMITGNAENTKQEVERKTKALFEAKQMAEEANKAKSNFTANISHEIRTPLNAIIGLINLCLKTTLSGQQNNYLQKAKLASGTLLSLINQTLDYSKIEAGKLELEQIKFDLPGVLQKVEAIFSAQAIQQGIDFSVEFPHLLPRFLLGDQLRLEQVLLNLCSNAFKFTEKGKVELHLEIESQTNTKVTLNFIVSDTGIGIPVEQQKNLFESFHQADSSTSRKFGGSGLGLAITKQIVEHMGGTIYLVSEENKGSQFYVKVELPLADESEFVSKESIAINYDTTAAYSSTTSSPQLNITDPITVDLINNDKKDPGATGRLLDNVSILLVEDILINQMIAQEILQEHGAKVITAENGLKALQELSDGQSFDAILMDIQMPEMDGYEATRKIRENEQFCHIPIIAMTANALATDIEQCKAAGMDDHIAKPFEEEDVLNKVLSHLNSTSLKIIS